MGEPNTHKARVLSIPWVEKRGGENVKELAGLEQRELLYYFLIW